MKPLWRSLLTVAGLFVFSIAGRAQTANGSISGQVVDADNNPVVAATVYLSAGPAVTGLSHAMQTDTDGKFRILDLPPGNYTLSAFKAQDGFGDPASPLFGNHNVLTPVSVASATETDQVQISLARPGGRLHVSAYDSVTQKPLLKATYVLRQVNNNNAVAQGEKDLPADFLLPPVDVTVELHVDGYQPWTMHDEGRAYVTLRPGESRHVHADMVPIQAPVTPAN